MAQHRGQPPYPSPWQGVTPGNDEPHGRDGPSHRPYPKGTQRDAYVVRLTQDARMDGSETMGVGVRDAWERLMPDVRTHTPLPYWMRVRQ